jgi:hypothetical protein
MKFALEHAEGIFGPKEVEDTAGGGRVHIEDLII